MIDWWEHFKLWSWQSVPLVSGGRSRLGANLARRKINGEWRYRELTEDEIAVAPYLVQRSKKIFGRIK